MPIPPGAPTVLVVDDEPAIVDSLQKILERESLRVLTAGSGGEALELLRRHPVSVLLTDLMMPGMSGMDLLRASKSVAPETETVLMTAYGTVENAVEAMKQGAYDFVTKPIKRAHLVRVVGKAIEKRSLVAGEPLAARAAGGRAAPVADRPVAAPGGGRWRSSCRRRRRRRRCCCWASRGPARSSWPGPSTTARRAPPGRSWRSTARRCPRASSRPSCSATRRGPSPGAVQRHEGRFAAGRRRHAVPRRDWRDSDARPGEAAARAAGGGGRAARAGAPSRSTCGWWPRPTRTCGPRCARGGSARTSTTA